MKPLYATIVLLAGISAALLNPGHVRSQDSPSVSSPPDSFFEIIRQRDREVAKAFYKKFIDIHGLAVVASAEVADAALRRTYEIVDHMLAGRPDIRQAMIDRKMYLIIIRASTGQRSPRRTLIVNGSTIGTTDPSVRVNS